MARRDLASRYRWKSISMKAWVKSMHESIKLIELNYALYEDLKISARHRTMYVSSRTVNSVCTDARYAFGETKWDFDCLYIFCWKNHTSIKSPDSLRLSKSISKTLNISRKIYADPLHIKIGYDRINTRVYNYNDILSNNEINPKLISAIDLHLKTVYKKYGKIIVDKDSKKNIITI